MRLRLYHFGIHEDLDSGEPKIPEAIHERTEIIFNGLQRIRSEIILHECRFSRYKYDQILLHVRINRILR